MTSLRVSDSRQESDRFGVRTARITVAAGADVSSSAAALGHALTQSDAELVILRYPSQLVALVGTAAIDADWLCLPGGAILYWQAPREASGIDVGEVTELVAADPLRDGRRVQAALLDSFEGYVNHYSANPAISPGSTEAGYVEWARNIARDPVNLVFAAWAGEEIVGAAVVTVDNDTWDINLAGVVAHARRAGHYRRLLAGIHSAALERRARLVISTQTHNIAVQNAWAGLGFRPISSFDTVHLVRRAAVQPTG